MFGGVYEGKRVLVTGNTGFKGSWLSTWLLHLGADVYGLALDVPTKPAMFDVLRLGEKVRHTFADLRDLDHANAIFREVRPDFVFHLAAQAIVSRSYRDPALTVTTNVVGTTNVLEWLRSTEHPCVAVLITSDKAYDNIEWLWGYRENDRLGGKDVYSGSKGAAELVIRSYVCSFLEALPHVRVGVGRAGNVLGGGDWSPDRIVADCVRAWNTGGKVKIRCPQATRPWQHVLEPLSGYLTLGAVLSSGGGLDGEAFNFGPRPEEDRTVAKLVGDLARRWGVISPDEAMATTGSSVFHEAGLLRLNCDKALAKLGWKSTNDYETTVRFVADWYRAYYQGSVDMHALTLGQLEEYCGSAKSQGLAWTE